MPSATVRWMTTPGARVVRGPVRGVLRRRGGLLQARRDRGQRPRRTERLRKRLDLHRRAPARQTRDQQGRKRGGGGGNSSAAPTWNCSPGRPSHAEAGMQRKSAAQTELRCDAAQEVGLPGTDHLRRHRQIDREPGEELPIVQFPARTLRYPGRRAKQHSCHLLTEGCSIPPPQVEYIPPEEAAEMGRRPDRAPAAGSCVAGGQLRGPPVDGEFLLIRPGGCVRAAACTAHRRAVVAEDRFRLHPGKQCEHLLRRVLALQSQAVVGDGSPGCVRPAGCRRGRTGPRPRRAPPSSTSLRPVVTIRPTKPILARIRVDGGLRLRGLPGLPRPLGLGFPGSRAATHPSAGCPRKAPRSLWRRLGHVLGKDAQRIRRCAPVRQGARASSTRPARRRDRRAGLRPTSAGRGTHRSQPRSRNAAKRGVVLRFGGVHDPVPDCTGSASTPVK